ncbi:MAG: ABC transporter ATP-binding protein/permease [Actinobacteria bacterium]|nr:ABC transporter ATP-binding protein/permease [Actinomycetota bacterium]MBW3649603.1 ABC transporter ATP-binding protein/permease [Actinomycetota bacterium]
MQRAALLSIMTTGLELARPWPLKVVFDRVLLARGTADPWGLAPVTVLVLAAVATFLTPLLIGTLNVRSTVAVAQVGRKATTRIRRQVFEHLHRLHFPFHQSSRTGDLLVRLMGDVNMVRDLLFASWINVLARGALVLATALIMVVLDPLLALVALAPMPLLVIGVGRSSRKLKEVTRKQRRREGDAAGRAAETLRQIRVVKAYAAEGRATEQFATDARAGERAGVKAAKLTAEMGRLTETLTGAGLALVLLVGARRVLAGSLSPGDLLVVMSYARSLYKPLNKISGEGGRLSKAGACAERLLEVLREPPEDTARGRPAPYFHGEVIVRDLHYAYPTGVEALRGVSMELRPGTLALVCGANGSGKSTLLSILLRLLVPDRGLVLLDGQPVEAFQLDSYRERIAYVPQDALLFGVTVRENILYGRPSATDAEVEQAARDAMIHDVIAALPDGYETELGENGASLSGGQARRLMLARAAVRAAPILLLDEPLAGLDPAARPLVAQAIRRMSTGRTTIVVSHGSDPELEPDVIVRLGEGRVEAVEDRVRRPSPSSESVTSG